ncbi:MAG: AAA family ATPase [Alphaproteobacteria bacterium]|nr:AAA family ATPase [Alphaproteobacteria bacterium]
MAVPVLTFFNHKSGVGKTSLVYHLAWMLSQMKDVDGNPYRVLACDLDPQANLTAAFLDEEQLEALWEDGSRGSTISKCVEPLQKVGDLLSPAVQKISPSLGLIPGDLALSWFEDRLSSEWPEARGSADLYRPFRILTAFWTVMQAGAAQMDASIILADVGPNLGAINRSALIATNHVVVPLGADLFSLQGLRNLGPTLRRWRQDWKKSLDNWSEPEFPLPYGQMQPIGYVVQQHSVRLSRPVRAYDKWVNRMPEAYAKNLLGKSEGPFPETPQQDPHCLATIKHFRSLVPMAQEARKPIFDLTVADGAIGSHAAAVRDARKDFRELAALLMERIGLAAGMSGPRLSPADMPQDP